jgi:hypothetical protein
LATEKPRLGIDHRCKPSSSAVLCEGGGGCLIRFWSPLLHSYSPRSPTSQSISSSYNSERNPGFLDCCLSLLSTSATFVHDKPQDHAPSALESTLPTPTKPTLFKLLPYHQYVATAMSFSSLVSDIAYRSSERPERAHDHMRALRRPVSAFLATSRASYMEDTAIRWRARGRQNDSLPR